MTPAQQKRQRHRARDGQYEKVNPCYACGKSAGDDYWSHPDTDCKINDELLCLCVDCLNKYNHLPGPEAVAAARKDHPKTMRQS